MLLQPVISIVFFFLQMIGNLTDVVLAGLLVLPELGALLVKLRRRFLEMLFKFSVIFFKILFANPLNIV